MPAQLLDILGPDGAIAPPTRRRYESRPQQLEMAAAVEQAFSDGHHLLVEAGTGVGKSFAYLLPAIDFAVKHKKRVVISTHTISLQEQLIDKDIPLLQSVYPDEFTAVLVKGRSNYLCQRRLEQTRGRQNYLFDDDRQLESLWTIEEWAQRTRRDGSLADLPQHARAAACGTRSAPSTATAWARSASSTRTASGRRPSAACRAGTSWSSITRCSSRDLALRMAGVNYLPKYDLVDPRRSAHGRRRRRRSISA